MNVIAPFIVGNRTTESSHFLRHPKATGASERKLIIIDLHSSKGWSVRKNIAACSVNELAVVGQLVNQFLHNSSYCHTCTASFFYTPVSDIVVQPGIG